MTMLKQYLFRCVNFVSVCVWALTVRGVGLGWCRHQGQIGAALVLGGVDSTGAHLFTVAPHGSTDKLPYVTMGSGSLAAMAVFESQWKKDLDVRALSLYSHLCPLMTYVPSVFAGAARERRQPSLRRHLRRNLQRLGLRLQRRRMRHHRRGDYDAAESYYAE